MSSQFESVFVVLHAYTFFLINIYFLYILDNQNAILSLYKKIPGIFAPCLKMMLKVKYDNFSLDDTSRFGRLTEFDPDWALLKKHAPRSY